MRAFSDAIARDELRKQRTLLQLIALGAQGKGEAIKKTARDLGEMD